MLKEGFMEFYYNKRRTKEQKQGILQHLIRRIDVGSQELTITWLFMRDGKRRIPRSAVDPKGGHAKPQKYDQKAQKGNVSEDCIVRQHASKKTPSGVSGGRLVEIGAANPLCVQHNPQSALLLSVLRASVHDACQRPAPHIKRGRKARRGKRVRA